MGIALKMMFPENWCPISRKSFNLEREIREALAAIARVEAESREQLRNVELGTEAEDDSSEEDHARAHDRRRKGWVEERLKEIGRQRARKWGWPNTYSYTKSLGEQLMFAARESVDITVVRPAVIEGALHDPFRDGTRASTRARRLPT